MSRMSKKRRFGFVFLLITAIGLVAKFFFLGADANIQHYADGVLIILFLISLALLFKFSGILFDPGEDRPNNSLKSVVVKIRYRAILYNNIAIILFFITIIIIFTCFYWFLKTEVSAGTEQSVWANAIASKFGAAILLIFLVQILFKIFKYLLRVAAFYNARADAIEVLLHNHYLEKEKADAAIDITEQKLDLEKLMNMFTPGNYDISELDKVTLFDGFLDIFKNKMGK
jgi:hypothetical protein